MACAGRRSRLDAARISVNVEGGGGGRQRKVRGHVVLVTEDVPFHFDNRVRREASTLCGAGYQCSVISQKPRKDPRHELPPVDLYMYRQVEVAGHVVEYIVALAGMWRCLRRIIKEKRAPEVLHAANPPDLLYWIAVPLRRRFGTKFIYDQHDLCPELYMSRQSGRGPHRALMLAALRYFERASYRAADHVIVTNESYRRVAMSRGGLPEERVTVVRNGPERSRFVHEGRWENPAPGRSLIGYLGTMNPQDGVEYLVRALYFLVKEVGRRDLHLVLIGGGGAVRGVQGLVQALGLSEYVTFAGRLPDRKMVAALKKCKVCVQPDPKNPLNDVSTMNKVMEYMALGKAVVAFDLKETRVTCGDCALYAEPNDERSLAENILRVVDDPQLASRLGTAGERRVWRELAWSQQKGALLKVYESVLR